MRALSLMTSIVIAAVMAGAAHAQGVLQVSFDKDAWPTQEVSRTIVVPQGMTQLQLTAGLFSTSQVSSYTIVPSVAYGLTRNITAGVGYDASIVTFDEFNNPGGSTSTSTNLTGGSLFAIARPFNDYDVGVRAAVPFNANEPLLFDLDLELVGRVELGLDTAALFFNGGVELNLYDSTPATPDRNSEHRNVYFVNADFARQISPVLSLSAGSQFALVSDNVTVDFHAKAQYAVTRDVDLFARPGIAIGDNDGKFIVVGANVWVH